MHPVFRIGPLEFPAYFTLLTVGCAMGLLLAWHRARRVHIDPNRFLDLGLWAILAGVVGARLLHVIADGHFLEYVHLCTDPLKVPGLPIPGGGHCASDAECSLLQLGDLCNPGAGTCHPGRDCLRAFKIWYGGLAFYGGLVLAIPVGFAFIRRHRMGVWRVCDLAAFGIPLGLFFGRLGCWFAGCCFGSPTRGSWGVTFPAGTPAFDQQLKAGLVDANALHTLSVVPAQLWSAGFNFAIFALIYFWIYPRRRYHGAAFSWFLLLYGAGRFLVEFFRSDDRGLWLGDTITTSQIIALPMMTVAIFMMFRLRKRYPLDRHPVDQPPGVWA